MNLAEFKENAQGAMVPISKIKPADLLRDDTVMRLISKAKDMHQILADFKQSALDDVRAFVDLSAEQYGANLGGKEGNMTLRSFDGKARIQISIAKPIVFDERLQIAKSLIDECITEWSEGANDNIRALVNDAFQVDSQGKINTARVLGLRRLDISDPKWLKAMEAISDSITVTASKEYLRFYIQDEANREQHIALDLAAI